MTPLSSKKNNEVYSSGGRVLNITSVSKNLIDAKNKSLEILQDIMSDQDQFYNGGFSPNKGQNQEEEDQLEDPDDV